MHLIFEGFNLAILVLVGLMFFFMPDIMNKYLLFGVTVNDEVLKDPATIDVKKSYRNKIAVFWLLCASAYAISSFYLSLTTLTFVFVGILFLLIISVYVFFYSAHKKIKDIKRMYQTTESSHQTIDTKEPRKFRTINNRWYLIYAVIILAVSYLTIDRYSGLPQKLAIHYDMYGNVDGYTDKSPGAVMMMPLIMLLITGVFLGVSYSMKSAKRVSGITGGKLSFEQESQFRYLWSAAIYASGLLMLGVFATVQFGILGIMKNNLLVLYMSLGATAGIIILFTILSIYTGQSGSRLKGGKDEKLLLDRDDDSHWKGGLVYFNRSDPTIFVHKRFGIGMTLNFGNPVSWIIFLAIIGFVVFSIVQSPGK